MFMMHAISFLGMLSLASGAALYIWSARTPGVGTGLGKLFGVLIMLFSLLGLGCITYTSYKMWDSNKHCPMCADMQSEEAVGGATDKSSSDSAAKPAKQSQASSSKHKKA